mmetsp:Transcript_10503/g.23547  ORF Transcript_10503/g.23547 Transcript_10503/m.23547 type:complete len:640 (+) Transcript_10503:193-2112(+)
MKTRSRIRRRDINMGMGTGTRIMLLTSINVISLLRHASALLPAQRSMSFSRPVLLPSSRPTTTAPSQTSNGSISSRSRGRSRTTTELNPTKTPLQERDEQTWKPGSVQDEFGTSALGQVRNLAAIVQKASGKRPSRRGSFVARGRNTGATGSLMKTLERTDTAGGNDDEGGVEDGGAWQQMRENDRTVVTALTRLENDMQLLDNLASERPQLSTLELSLLLTSVFAAATSPIMFADLKVAEVLAPASAAFAASLGIGAEYIGKVAVADGKEVAAATIQCAAEAEGFLANAERVKAVTPLCVGVGATGASFALLAPVIIDALQIGTNTQLVTELYLFCPLISVLSAAVAGLALQEIRQFTSRAISVGNRRFAKSGIVGRTWLSSTELIDKKSAGTSDRWRSFGLGVLPAPIFGALVPGALATKCIVVAALAAAQSAFFLAQAESVMARATDAVALKARSAAVCDTYANQGARSAAVLPFTSALSAFCAAATAAVVELPWLESLATLSGPVGTTGQVALVSVFPTLGAMFAAAASVSKARCEVDAEAASQAASTLALEYDKYDAEEDPVLNPFRGVVDLIRITAKNGIKVARGRSKKLLSSKAFAPLRAFLKILRKLGRRGGSKKNEGNGGEVATATVLYS